MKHPEWTEQQEADYCEARENVDRENYREAYAALVDERNAQQHRPVDTVAALAQPDPRQGPPRGATEAGQKPERPEG